MSLNVEQCIKRIFMFGNGIGLVLSSYGRVELYGGKGEAYYTLCVVEVLCTVGRAL